MSETTDHTKQYAPGDIANGHVLTETGQWLPVGGPPAPTQPKGKKPIYKRWWAIALAAVFVIGGMSSAMGSGESDADKASADTTPAASTPDKKEAEAEKAEAEKAEAEKAEAEKAEAEKAEAEKAEAEKAEAEKAEAEKAEAEKAASEVVTVGAAQIIQEFEDNELAADAKYKGKTLKITGIVEKIDTELFDDSDYVLDLAGGGDFEILTVSVYDIPNEDLAAINKGDKVTVTADFKDGGDLGVEVNHGVLN